MRVRIARSIARRLVLVAAIVSSAAVGVPSAVAGGTQVSVVVTAGRVWVTTGGDIAELDASSGHVLRRIGARYPYVIAIGASDGAIWASSVENGFVAGAVTRIPFGTGHVTHPLVRPREAILGLAVGSTTTWAVVGPWRSATLAAVDHADGHVTVRRLRTPLGWIAADDTGETPGLFGVTASPSSAATGQVVALEPSGAPRWRAATPPIMSPLAVGLGSVWAASAAALYRIDPRTGRTQGSVAIDDASAQLAVGGGRIWVLAVTQAPSRQRYELLEVDPRNLRVVARTRITNQADAIAYGDGAVWLGRDVPTVSVVRVDPTTLRQTLFAANLG